jgi:hypothetical protein
MVINYPPDYQPGQLPSQSSVLPGTADDPAEQGALAYFAGREITDNPYPIPGRRAGEWDRGFRETEDQVESEVEYGGEG